MADDGDLAASFAVTLPARKQLKKSQPVLSGFDAQVDDPGSTVATYVSADAPRVRGIDLELAVPAVFA